jgi:hypothetical protein
MACLTVRPALAYQQYLLVCVADVVFAFSGRLRGWLLSAACAERSRQKDGKNRVHDR